MRLLILCHKNAPLQGDSVAHQGQLIYGCAKLSI